MKAITELTGIQLQTAMLTLRLAGHDDAANVFQAELTRRAAEPTPAELAAGVEDDSVSLEQYLRNLRCR